MPEYTLLRPEKYAFLRHTFWRRGGTPESQTDRLLLYQIAFPRFRENQELNPRAFQKSDPAKSRIPIPETRED